MVWVYYSMSKSVCCARVCTNVWLPQTHITNHGLLAYNSKSILLWPDESSRQEYLEFLAGVPGLTLVAYTAVKQETFFFFKQSVMWRPSPMVGLWTPQVLLGSHGLHSHINLLRYIHIHSKITKKCYFSTVSHCLYDSGQVTQKSD